MERKKLWNKVGNVFGCYDGKWCLARDFNVVRIVTKSSARAAIESMMDLDKLVDEIRMIKME